MNRVTLKSLTIAACLISSCRHIAHAGPVSPIAPGDVIFTTDGLEKWYKLDPVTAAVTPLVRWNRFPFSPASTIAFDVDGSILYDALGDVYRLNPWTGYVEPLNIHFAGSDISSLGFVVEDNGDLLIARDHFIGRFSRATQLTSAVTGRPGMSPRGITQNESGHVFVLESTQITEVDPANGARTLIADWSNPNSRLIDAQPDGHLIIGGSIFHPLYSVDIASGIVDVFSDDLPIAVRDFALDEAGNLWLTSIDGIYRYSNTGGAATLIADRNIGRGARLIAVVPSNWTPPPVPEPAGCVLFVCCSASGIFLHRNRSAGDHINCFAGG